MPKPGLLTEPVLEVIELELIKLPVPLVIKTPAPPLKAIELPA